MGNASSVRQVGEEREDSSAQDLIGQSPPHTPRGAPLLITPQVPMEPLQRFGEPRGARMHNPSSEDYVSEQGIPTIITWGHGGKEVAVEGSWDDYKTRKILQKSGKDFIIMKVLPSGFYQYRFIVDGRWRYSPDLPWTHDETGNAYNILDLQDSVPEEIESIVGFEPPQSPESSYNNRPPASEDYAKEPPLLPPQLHVALLNTANSDRSSSLSRPQHVVLNHLYIQKGENAHPVVALGSTRRFMSKYVTVVMYKPLQR